MELVGVDEIAEMARITKREAENLVRKTSFPAPVGSISRGRIWARDQVARWLRAGQPASPHGDYVGVTEIVDITGLSEARIYQLLRAGKLPPPVATLHMGRVWRRTDIETWHETREPVGGRPRKADTA